MKWSDSTDVQKAQQKGNDTMDKPFIETGFLITENDFINMTLTRKRYITPKENKVILRVLGFIAVLLGVVAYIFLRGNLYQIICWILLIAIGLFVLFYYDVINPAMIITQSKNFYSLNKKQITSKTVKIYENMFEIVSDRYRASVPKKYIYMIVESKNTIMIFLDKDEFCFIPTRVFSEEELSKFREFSQSLKDKYKFI